MPFRYPICLEVDGRRCLVVGGGDVAEHKVRGLLDAGAGVVVVAEAVTAELDRLAAEGSLEWVRRPYAGGDLEGAWLAVAATDDPACNAAVFDEGEHRGVLVNAVDDVQHCHFSVPSIVRRGDFMLTISTGGRAPALSKRLRQSLSAQFGPELAAVVDLLAEAREVALPRRQVDFGTWARRWEQALDHDLIAAVREGRVDEARAAVVGALAGDPQHDRLRSDA